MRNSLYFLRFLTQGRSALLGFVPHPLTFGFIILVSLSFAACSKTQEAKSASANEALAVRLYPVEEQIVKRRVEAVGSLYPIEESTVSSEVEGRVDRVLVDVGDVVHGGQILVEISPVELQLDLERATAAVGQVRARLGMGSGDPPPSDPTTVAFVQRAAADLFDADQKYQRAQQLFRDQLISQQQLDEAASRSKGARAAYDVALQDVDQLKAQLLSSEAALRLAEKKLADAKIRAPFPGAIKERRVSPGEFLRVQSPVMVIVRTDQLRARLAVPERWAGAVDEGGTVQMQVEAYPDETFRGRLERINPAVRQETRSFEVEALVPNPDGRLKPGFFVQAALPSEVQEKMLTVAAEAVNYRYGVYKVFVLNGNKVEEREIKPGAQQDARIEIVQGLKAGDRVAVALEGELADGTPVREATGGSAAGK